VTKLVGKTSYQLALPPQWKVHNVFHGTLLLPYVETVEHGRNFEELPLELIENEEEYKVEEILGSRRKHHQLQYLIKWKGYSAAHNSWEPKRDIHAKDLIEKFHKYQPMAIRASRASSFDHCTPQPSEEYMDNYSYCQSYYLDKED
jgi:hypothetical protein